MNNYHKSVLLHEAIELLKIQEDKKYIDATLGGGGHAGEITRQGGLVLGIDADQDAIDFVSALKNDKLIIAKGNFKDIEEIARVNGFGEVSGVIFDLGVSSHQVDEGSRGFSFQKTGDFDMRMDRDLKVKAKDLINSLTKNELYELFTKLGEEHRAHAIANGIVKARKVRPIETTTEVSEIIKIAIKGQSIDTLARVFQAFRIAINDELNSLKVALPQAFNLLVRNGRIAVISFHSLEDRIVKNQFLAWEQEKKGAIITAKPVRPSEDEIRENRRSRSSKLRVIEKV